MRINHICFVLLLLSTVFTQVLIAQDIFDVARIGTTVQLISTLEENPTLVNSKNGDGYSPLILAAYHSNTNIVKTLLSRGASVDEGSGYGTALMAATVKGEAAIVKLLLDYKANPNLKDKNGITALLYATMFQQDEIVALLLNHNADISIKDNRGNTALDYATLMKNETLINLLKKFL